MGIDLSRLPAPQLVDASTFETIRDEMLTDFTTRMLVFNPDFVAPLVSDPAYKIIEDYAYRELNYRQRVNEAALATLLAFAVDGDLDQIGARYNVARLVLQVADPDAIPPVPAIYESNPDYRARIQGSFDGFSVAGPEGAYEFWAQSADPNVKDAKAESPSPCDVVVTVLSRLGDGTADSTLLSHVTAKLSAFNIRPLGDQLTVQSATIVTYAIAAALEIDDGPDPAIVRAASHAALQAYADARHRVGFKVTMAGLYAAAKVDGVIDVTFSSPTASIVPSADEAAYCTGVTVT